MSPTPVEPYSSSHTLEQAIGAPDNAAKHFERRAPLDAAERAGLRVEKSEGVACPPWWLPPFLANHGQVHSGNQVAHVDDGKPHRDLTSHHGRRLLDNVLTSKTDLKTAVDAYNADPTAAIVTYPRFALMVCNAGIAFGLLLLLICAVFKSSRKPHLSAPHRHRINRRLTPVLVLNTPYLLDRSSGDIYLSSDSLDKNRPETWGTCAGNITDVDHNGQLVPKDQAAPGISPHEHRTEMRNGPTVGCPAGFSNLRSKDVQTPKETNATSTLRKQPGGMQSATFLMSDLAVISAAGFAVFLQLWHYPDQHLSRTINFLFLVQTLGSFAPGLYRIMRYRPGLFKPDGSWGISVIGNIKLHAAITFIGMLIHCVDSESAVGDGILLVALCLSVPLTFTFPRVVKEEGALLGWMGGLQILMRVVLLAGFRAYSFRLLTTLVLCQALVGRVLRMFIVYFRMLNASFAEGSCVGGLYSVPFLVLGMVFCFGGGPLLGFELSEAFVSYFRLIMVAKLLVVLRKCAEASCIDQPDNTSRFPDALLLDQPGSACLNLVGIRRYFCENTMDAAALSMALCLYAACAIDPLVLVTADNGRALVSSSAICFAVMLLLVLLRLGHVRAPVAATRSGYTPPQVLELAEVYLQVLLCLACFVGMKTPMNPLFFGMFGMLCLPPHALGSFVSQSIRYWPSKGSLFLERKMLDNAHEVIIHVAIATVCGSIIWA